MSKSIIKRLDSKCEDIKRLIFQVKHSNGVQYKMLEDKIQSDLEDIKVEFDNLLHNTMNDFVIVTKEEYDKLMLAKNYLETDYYADTDSVKILTPTGRTRQLVKEELNRKFGDDGK